MPYSQEEQEVEIVQDDQVISPVMENLPSMYLKPAPNVSETHIPSSLSQQALSEAASAAVSRTTRWRHDGDMDDDTRAIIEQMLAEEELYFGKSSLEKKLEGKTKKIKYKKDMEKDDHEKDDSRPSSTIPSSASQAYYSSSSHLPSHNQRWTNEEDNRLFDAMKMHGIGRWQAIARTLGTRTPLQVKNHARYLLASYKLSMAEPMKERKPQDITLSSSEGSESKKRRKEKPKMTTISPSPQFHAQSPDRNYALEDDDEEEEEEEEDVEIDIEDDEDNCTDNQFKSLITLQLQSLTAGSAAGAACDRSNEKSTILSSSTSLENAPVFGNAVEAIKDIADGTIVKLEENYLSVEQKQPLLDGDVKLSLDEKLCVNATKDVVSETSHLSHVIDKQERDDDNKNECGSFHRDVDSDLEQDEDTMASEEKLIEKGVITEEEMSVHKEFFSGHVSKTSDRYVRIRDHLIELWHRQKPKYLTKTAARQGLKDCGDVNAIGRVHGWLERVGAINFDADEQSKRTARPRNEVDHEKKMTERMRKQEKLEKLSLQQDALFLTTDEKRKRRVRDPASGEWLFERELEGRTTEHMTMAELQELAEQRRLKRLNAKYFESGDDDHDSDDDNDTQHFDGSFDGDGQQKRKGVSVKRKKSARGNHFAYDPFQLITLMKYHSLKTPPFHVVVYSNTLLIMDLHAHLAETEIIGLLGGQFDALQHTLTISSVFPCHSISTGLQCEMDPVSEMQARDHFASMQQIVVGWYHSHPTFEPNPSIRDIENQTAYQSLFQLASGVEPFIGVIATPYDPQYPANQSIFQYIHIDSDWNESHSYRIPYACEKTIVPSSSLSIELFNQMVDLLQSYCKYKHRENLMSTFRTGDSTTKLEKLLKSLRSNIYGVSDDDQQRFMEKFEEVLRAIWFCPE